jgi:signal transduction histidine kinase
MPSKFLDRLRKSLGFRLAVWYFVIFVASSLAVSIVSYIFLSSSLRDNRKAIQMKLQELVTLTQKAGVEAVEQTAAAQHASRRTAFFVRILSPENRVVFLNTPPLWTRFDIGSVLDRPVDGAWQYVTSMGDGDVLEVTSTRLPNGYWLQVGRTLEDRGEILEDYRNTITGVTLPMMLIALTGGALLAFRAVRPIRSLIQTAQSIVDTGRMDVRVPEGRTGGELDELVKLFNQMLERIETLIKGIREALDNVAHDLRTPMTRLRGVAEMSLQAPPGEAQYREALATCIEESDRILSLLNCLMDVSEAETGTMRLEVATFRVLPLVEEVVELYQYVAEEKRISISVQCAEELVGMADRSRLRQVLANLLDNAIKYNSPGGRVFIKARQEQQQTVLLVKDSGIGIPAKELPKIWDRLHRGDKSRSEPGLGLGLSLVRAIVHAHNGSLDVQSQPGAGSAFTFRLPILPSQ